MLVYLNNVSNKKYDLDLLSKTITSPEPKKYTVDIPHSDGVLDITSYFGSVRYNNRKITIEFEIRKNRSEWESLMSTLRNTYHGQMVNVTFNDDEEYYWVGRCTVGEIDDHGSTAGVKMEFDTKPYKYLISDPTQKSL